MFAQESVMELKREIELFEEILLSNPDFDKALLEKDWNGDYRDCEISDLLGIFQAGIEAAERKARQDAKGFLLVPMKPTEKTINAMKRSRRQFSTYAAETMYEAIIEAQEQSHE